MCTSNTYDKCNNCLRDYCENHIENHQCVEYNPTTNPDFNENADDGEEGMPLTKKKKKEVRRQAKKQRNRKSKELSVHEFDSGCDDAPAGTIAVDSRDERNDGKKRAQAAVDGEHTAKRVKTKTKPKKIAAVSDDDSTGSENGGDFSTKMSRRSLLQGSITRSSARPRRSTSLQASTAINCTGSTDYHEKPHLLYMEQVHR